MTKNGWGDLDDGELSDPENACLNCGQLGHFTSQCNNKRAPETCHNCGEEGHMRSSCPQRTQLTKCFACGKEGHRKSECPSNCLASRRSSSAPSPNIRPSIRCFKCGGIGHMSTVCPSADTSGRTFRSPAPKVSHGVQQSYGRPPVNRSPSTSNVSGNGGRTQRCANTSQSKGKSGIVRDTVTISEADALNRNEAGENFQRYEKLNVKLSDHTFEEKKLETFEQANLDGALMDVVRKCNYQSLTPIQRYAIPVIAEGRDLLAVCETGSGKTAAFLLPILDKIISLKVQPPRGKGQTPLAVIVVPTRELAVQLVKDTKNFLKRSPIEAMECYGGTDVMKEQRNIERGTQILVGTIGRIMHFLREGVILFDKLRYLVLDEADDMLQGDFRGHVNSILALAKDSRPQVLMFSATFPQSILDIAEVYLNKLYVRIQVGVSGCASDNVQQKVIKVTQHDKLPTLVDIIREELAKDSNAKILVFVETKIRADWLANALVENNIKCSSLHGNRSPVERQKAVTDMQNGEIAVIVATSVASRGLDIIRMTVVVNYDLPDNIEDYINRIGRTGRVGNRGQAIAFFDPRDDNLLAAELKNCLMDAGVAVPDFLT